MTISLHTLIIKGFILETAHPVKFSDVVEKIAGEEIAMPGSIHGLLSQQKQSTLIPSQYDALRTHLMGSR
jgi:threonine synthase